VFGPKRRTGGGKKSQSGINAQTGGAM